MFETTENEPALDLSRVHVLERGNQLLVMDRISGRWLYLPGELRPIVSLVGSDDLESDAGELGDAVRSLRGLLSSKQVGVSGSERHFDRLNTVILKLTNGCNLACTYCYDYETVEKARALDRDVARSAVAQALDLCEGRLEIILHGGEPMLMWGLIESVVLDAEALAADRGVRLRFNGQTNMTRVDDSIVHFSVEHHIAWGISLDGPPAQHDRFRVRHDGRGSYEAFANALERYPDFVRRCSAMTTITSATDSRLLEIARHARDLGLAGWDWSLFQPIGRGRDARGVAFDVDRLLESWEELFEAVLSGEFAGFPVMPVLKYSQNFFNGPGANMCMRSECGAARDLLSISSDGTIEACDCIDPLGPLGGLGHVSKDSLAQARQGAIAQRLRDRDVQHLRCGTCIWFGVCGGTCLAHAGGVDEIWDDGCLVALLAFDRISDALSKGSTLQEYMRSVGA